MKILLDENLPESLVAELAKLGHDVTSVNRLRLKGVKNGSLYREIAREFDLCFTKDAGFAHMVRHMRRSSAVKVLRVALPQEYAAKFVEIFCGEFVKTDWLKYENGSVRPASP